MAKLKLYLAPMEGLGDRPFRKAIAQIGGFDEGSTEFIRVPTNAHIPSLAKVYDPDEIAPIPLAAQVMGSDPILMAKMAIELERKRAPRVDLNCGCPSNTVTGRGAGSSLLKDPDALFTLASGIKAGICVPFTLKIRSGYNDLSLFDEILDAAEKSGAHHVTLHPRTKKEGYGPPANWALIARAKKRLTIPVIGSGDVKTPEDAFRMVEETGCDGVMIGRGAAANPWIFQEIRAVEGEAVLPKRTLPSFIKSYAKNLLDVPTKTQINKLKGIIRHLLGERSRPLLRERPPSLEAFIEQIVKNI